MEAGALYSEHKAQIVKNWNNIKIHSKFPVLC